MSFIGNERFPAVVSGNSSVQGDAKIFDGTSISGRAKIGGRVVAHFSTFKEDAVVCGD